VPLITLSTDFGTRDSYVSQMKGIILQRSANAQIVDLTHDIAPQDILGGALFVGGAAPYFPADTIHVAVVDPGVGASRHSMVARAKGQFFVGPDNGIFTQILERDDRAECLVIKHPDCFLESVSATFYGRDVFAPTAAALANGLPFEKIGDPIAKPVMLAIPKPMWVGPGLLRGVVLHIDRFGNVQMNVRDADLVVHDGAVCHIGKHTVREFVGTYDDAPPNTPVMLVGSTGYLEVAVRNGNAATHLKVAMGAVVEIEFTK
jgi:S-adenosylmethionine hydrolase